ncbi:MAG TPA: nucleoside triphosphate pyrophosphohydrolase [Dehalococcoidia bacterium]|nr:nucleoside triphosphate pyrophosphohydrolase [Dehalococcoidia bacterium]
MPKEQLDLQTFAGLRHIIARLRAPDGCPWDREQTHQSLRPYLLEETAEALEALDEGDAAHLAEELGDLLLQILMHSQMAEESGDFTIDDVIASIAAKLVRRHPHVFGDARAETAGQVIEQWEDLKRKERGGEERESALDGVPSTLPALARAQAVQRRAVATGFAWENDEQAWEKLLEELGELRSAATPEERLHELGDVLFALTEVARRDGLDAEEAMRLSLRRFDTAFRAMEAALRERGQSFHDLATEEKLRLWREVRQAGE